MNNNVILQTIGEPACLEQLAEECCELSQAALKLARIKRGENPTPKGEYEVVLDLIEEVADVLLCMDVVNAASYWSESEIDSFIGFKQHRWLERLKDGV